MTKSRDISEMKESQVAKAWCYFGGGTYNSVNPYIVRSFNVSSVTDASTSTAGGQYTVNFENNMESAGYVVATSAGINGDGTVSSVWANTKSISSVDLFGLANYGTNISFINMGSINFVVFE